MYRAGHLQAPIAYQGADDVFRLGDEDLGHEVHDAAGDGRRRAGGAGVGPLADRHEEDDAELVQDEGVGVDVVVLVGQRRHREDEFLCDGYQQAGVGEDLDREPVHGGIDARVDRPHVV
ncbi:hypothetical protein [Streptomyces subrutilus]|uniref:hypothetical protein n=1 Tax=Streptomyces subrutilus TaxID=36818 RepID=UPI00114D3489|nr:hypothetical protein [Streptomyces subrutilus]